MLCLKYQLQHLYLPCISRKTCRELQNSAWIYFFRKIVRKNHKKVSWRLDFYTSITELHIWNATTFANNARTISIPPAPLSQTAPYLSPFLFIGGSVSAGTSTNIGVRYNPYLGSISRLFFERISMTLKFLLTRPRAESNVTLSFSRKRYKIGLLTLNTSNPFSMNSMRRELWKNPTLFGSSAKVSNYW